MIQNNAQLQVVIDQIALAEHALASLRKEVKNERNFAVFSEAYVDQIAALRAEIDAYQSAAKETGKTPSQGANRRPRQAS